MAMADSDGLRELLVQLRALGSGPAPVPSSELAALLAGSPLVRATRRTWLVSGASTVAFLGVASTSWAAAANELPAPLQSVVHDFSHRYLPFQFPEPSADSAPEPGPGAPAIVPGTLDGESTGADPESRLTPSPAASADPTGLTAPTTGATASPTGGLTPGGNQAGPSVGSSPTSGSSGTPSPSPSPTGNGAGNGTDGETIPVSPVTAPTPTPTEPAPSEPAPSEPAPSATTTATPVAAD